MAKKYKKVFFIIRKAERPAMDEALGLLQVEESLLGKLLYRNQNQHGKSKLFNYLKRVRRTLLFLPRDRVSELNKLGEAVLRLKTSSSSSGDMSSRLEVLSNQQKATRACLECGEYCLKALDVLKDQLTRQLFVPLFTTLLALTCRILQCVSTIVVAVQSQHQALVVQLKNVSLLSSKNKIAITDAMDRARLSSEQELLLSVIANRPDREKDAPAAAAALQPAPLNAFDDEGEEISASSINEAAQVTAKKRKLR